MNTTKIYHDTRKYFTIILPLLSPTIFFHNSPCGRFAPSAPSIFLLDGIKAWVFQELVSPLTFIPSFLSNTSHTRILLPLHHPANILAACFLIHYANRALISPLRTPSRSKTHISVVISAVIFNLCNGFLMGTYLSSPFALTFLASSYSRLSFYAGLWIWALGFLGNIWHDEILLNIRRRKPQVPAVVAPREDGKLEPEHYAIPYGGLYSYISYPNYFCEWIEWIGFAMAAAPFPSFVPFCFDVPPCVTVSTFPPATAVIWSEAPLPPPFDLSPPYIFLLAEVLLMLPRAYNGHKWYQDRFEEYPKERKAVVPFVL